jgi:hypothetical protein
MREEAPLAKTVRINRLFDAYRNLLTEKQRTFLHHYFQEDYTLGEIAQQFAISRQAVYEHIKRAEQVLEDYEAKLQLVRRQDERRLILDRLREAAETLSDGRLAAIAELVRELERLETAGEEPSGADPADHAGADDGRI